ncbi:MAG TPA: transcriptional regulator [Euryarchaeota archaeon]|nr:transcriptional regulator [Euryarchaeota archaeon]
MGHKEVCPVTEAINILRKKWHIAIIHFLLDGPIGFNELKPDILPRLKRLSDNSISVVKRIKMAKV